MGMRVDIVTLFPEMCQQVLDASIIGRAARRGYIETHCHQIRDYTLNKQKQTDDYPYVGGRWSAATMRASTSASLKRLRTKRSRLATISSPAASWPASWWPTASSASSPAFWRSRRATRKRATGMACWNTPSTPAPRSGRAALYPTFCWAATTRRKSRERTRLRRPELYEQWCESHPITELPKWKRGENVRLVKTEEQFAAAAKLFAEGRRAVCAGNWTEEYCASLTEEEFLAQLKAEKKGGWACYLHTTKDVPDGMVSVDHKTGRIEHLFVSGNAQGKGIGQKMLDFARKKLEEYEHPRLSVLDTNARAIALYRRMGWKFTGEKDMEFDPAEYPSVVKKCALLWMQYEG